MEKKKEASKNWGMIIIIFFIFILLLEKKYVDLAMEFYQIFSHFLI